MIPTHLIVPAAPSLLLLGEWDKR